MLLEDASRPFPEKELLGAMLLRAWTDLFSHEPLVVRNSVSWILDRRHPNGTPGFTFEQVFSHLDIDEKLLNQLVNKAIELRNR